MDNAMFTTHVLTRKCLSRWLIVTNCWVYCSTHKNPFWDPPLLQGPKNQVPHEAITPRFPVLPFASRIVSGCPATTRRLFWYGTNHGRHGQHHLKCYRSVGRRAQRGQSHDHQRGNGTNHQSDRSEE